MFGVFLERFEELLLSIIWNNFRNKILLCGDVNLNFFNQLNRTVKQFTELLACLILRLLSEVPTRITEVSEKLMVNIITNEFATVSAAECIGLGFLDHLALQIHVEVTSKVRAYTNECRRNFREHNYLDFHNMPPSEAYIRTF